MWIDKNIAPWNIYNYEVKEIIVYRNTPYQKIYFVENESYSKVFVLGKK